MIRNHEIEAIWVDLWNELYTIKDNLWHLDCLLPQGVVVDFDECLAWLQNQVYAEKCYQIEAGWVCGKMGAIIIDMSANESC